MKSTFPVTEGRFKPEHFWDYDCHCPEPEVSESRVICLKCGGANPVVPEKKRRKRL